MKNLSLDHEQAYKLQKKYYLDYGTTLNGLMLNHSINPINFLDYVHNINIDNIEPNFELNNALKKLKGTKYVYTNGSKNHAIRVLKKLNIFEHFNDIFDIESANFIPKPKMPSIRRGPLNTLSGQDMASLISVGWVIEPPKGTKETGIEQYTRLMVDIQGKLAQIQKIIPILEMNEDG